MEQSFIKEMDQNFLESHGIQKEQIEKIANLCEKAIHEKLYTNTPDFQHDLKHIERVMTYAQMILNQRKEKDIDEDIVLFSALYHDIGKTIGASNKEHGKIGSIEFKKRKDGVIDEKTLSIISLLIENHNKEENQIDFTSTSFNETEKEKIQMMSNILKDAAALDRNRLNYPPPIGNCDIRYLRTEEAKKILPITNSFLMKYQESQIHEKEKNSNSKILNNVEKLTEWLNDYESGKETFIYHASLTPAIEEIQPKVSTQAGKYVYADVDPVKCSTMAAFRFSLLIGRNRKEKTVTENFPNAISSAIDGKFMTIYRLPKEKFRPYVGKETGAPSGEWICDTSVQPVEEVTLPANQYFQLIENMDLIHLKSNPSYENQVKSVLNSLRMYIWGLQKEENSMEENYQQMEKMVDYYNPDLVPIAKMSKEKADELIKEHISYCEENHIPIDFKDEENHLAPILNKYREYEKEEYLVFTERNQNQDEEHQPLQKTQLNETKDLLLMEQKERENQNKKEESLNLHQEQPEQNKTDGMPLSLKMKSSNGYIKTITILISTILLGIILAILLHN